MAVFAPRVDSCLAVISAMPIARSGRFSSRPTAMITRAFSRWVLLRLAADTALATTGALTAATAVTATAPMAADLMVNTGDPSQRFGS
ncbi:hypothetical protein CGZ93_17175 [Enemella dayhoffiae]|uniref:Uncharacterized protein n=1 Tax=Enemella dayhoffiae TaxID=2016507 RepID=A0A255GPF7_9ACTN|nr:hypothetical protein [Enemella dayhoffiae]OYO17292.1 hypothetical protein CGZ93_17175 [Enemella dayhoffiae]